MDYKCLIFTDSETAHRWRVAHDYLPNASTALQEWFLNFLESPVPYPNSQGTQEFTSVVELEPDRYIYNGQPLSGFSVLIYSQMYESLLASGGLWDETVNLLGEPSLIVDRSDIVRIEDDLSSD